MGLPRSRKIKLREAAETDSTLRSWARSHQLRDPTEERRHRCRPSEALNLPAGVREDAPATLQVWEPLLLGLPGPGLDSRCWEAGGARAWGWADRVHGELQNPHGSRTGQRCVRGSGAASLSEALGHPRLNSPNVPWLKQAIAFRKRCLTSVKRKGNETLSASLKISLGEGEKRVLLTAQILSACICRNPTQRRSSVLKFSSGRASPPNACPDVRGSAVPVADIVQLGLWEGIDPGAHRQPRMTIRTANSRVHCYLLRANTSKRVSSEAKTGHCTQKGQSPNPNQVSRSQLGARDTVIWMINSLETTTRVFPSLSIPALSKTRPGQ